MDDISNLISDYLNSNYSSIDRYKYNQIIKLSKNEIIKNIYNKIALSLSEKDLAKLLILLNDGNPSNRELCMYLDECGISLDMIIIDTCSEFLRS